MKFLAEMKIGFLCIFLQNFWRDTRSNFNFGRKFHLLFRPKYIEGRKFSAKIKRNIDPRSQVSPQGELCPQGLNLSTWGEDPFGHPFVLLKRRVCSPPNKGVHIATRSQSSPMGTNLIPAGKYCVIKTGLRCSIRTHDLVNIGHFFDHNNFSKLRPNGLFRNKTFHDVLCFSRDWCINKISD
jgi:hypothetical protein